MNNYPQTSVLKHRLSNVSLLVTAIAMAGVLAGCGGGGGGGADAPAPAPAPAPVVKAVLTSPTNNQFQWRISSPMSVNLVDAQNANVAGPLTCKAVDTATVQIAADCSSARLLRLGNQTISVSNSTQSATLALNGIAQKQALASSPVSNLTGGQGTFSATGADGRPLFWGSNASSALAQLKTQTELDSVGLPVVGKQTATSDLMNIANVSTGQESSLALDQNGQVWSWGTNSNNQLARNVVGASALLGKVQNAAGGDLSGIVQIGVGDWNASALSDTGSVYSWGWVNTLGQGASATGTRPNLVKLPDGVTALSNIAQISVGRNFSCALSQDGRVFSWGRDLDGSTGTGAANIGQVVQYATSVIDASDQALSNIIAISCGYANGAAVTATGNVYTWGRNSSGQLGQGAVSFDAARTGKASLAAAPLGIAGNLSDIASISVGGDHMLALTKLGKAFAWGLATSSQLGQGVSINVGNESARPVAVTSLTGLTQLSDIKGIAATYSGSYALVSTGEIVAWGSNFKFALAQSSLTPSTSATPVKVKDAGGTSFLNLGSLSDFKNLNRQIQ